MGYGDPVAIGWPICLGWEAGSGGNAAATQSDTAGGLGMVAGS